MEGVVRMWVSKNSTLPLLAGRQGRKVSAPSWEHSHLRELALGIDGKVGV